jgi:hypothetical protein
MSLYVKDERVSLAGLWKKDTSNGKRFYAGRVKGGEDMTQLIAMLTENEERGLDVTLWVNKDKKSEAHPDTSLVIAPGWIPPGQEETTDEEVEDYDDL